VLFRSLFVYPNPAGDVLTVGANNDLPLQRVEIYTLSGTLVLVSNETTINIGHLPTGIYVVKAGGKSAKVVKQ
jgi:hypothetical protein